MDGGGSIVDIVGLTDEGNTYCCKDCQTHLALSDDVVSKSFHTMNGRAYLFNNVVNVFVGTKEERLMMTGMHTIADIFCVQCRLDLGWKYETVDHESQKYKEGKFVLERNKILGPDRRNPSDTLAVQIGRLRIAAEENS